MLLLKLWLIETVLSSFHRQIIKITEITDQTVSVQGDKFGFIKVLTVSSLKVGVIVIKKIFENYFNKMLSSKVSTLFPSSCN